jgi:hydroxypyruvate isomerase
MRKHYHLEMTLSDYRRFEAMTSDFNSSIAFASDHGDSTGRRMVHCMADLSEDELLTTKLAINLTNIVPIIT